MRERVVNGRFPLVVPDHVAVWDAIDHHEVERIDHMLDRLQLGMVLYDIGAEHGWMSALLARYGVGGFNVVLVEPTPHFWANIKRCWDYNGLERPEAMICARVGAESRNCQLMATWWPGTAFDDESPATAYAAPRLDEPVTTIDEIATFCRPPDAITIDVEGAELEVLRGARKTLELHMPLVWVSVHHDLLEERRQRASEIHHLMHQLGYQGHLIAVDHEEHWFFTP